MLIWAGLGILCLGAAVIGTVYYRHFKPKEPPDMLAVYRANNRGVAYIEQFKDGYEKAVNEFEQVVEMAPEWLPGKINLGIGLLNLARGGGFKEEEKKQIYQRAIGLFNDVLAREPDNPHAHFCLGIIYYETDYNLQEARPHFEAVTRIDPNDPYGWFWLGKTLADGEEERASECYKRSLELNPYLNPAFEGLRLWLRKTDPEKSAALLKEVQALREAEWFDAVDPQYYTEIGHYAEVIGRVPPLSAPIGPIPIFQREDNLQIELATGTRWATAADFGNDLVGDLRRQIRTRFGGTMVVFDYNGDGKPDVLLLSAVVEKGRVRDLLLRNEGEGRFTDVTKEAGLAEARPSLGCCVADFDNDGKPDLLITGIGEQHLFRNNGQGKFEDVTKKCGLENLKSVCLSAAFVDLDQDGDLDLIVSQYAETAEAALERLKGGARSREAGIRVYINVGVSVPLEGANGTEPLINPRFLLAQESVAPPAILSPLERRLVFTAGGPNSDFQGNGRAVVGVILGDFDFDRDIDFIVLADKAPAEMLVNDRLLRFHRADLPTSLLPLGNWNGGLVLDAAHEGRSDLFMIGPETPPLLLLNRSKRGQANPQNWFEPGAVKSPALRQARAVDLDLDGWADVVGLSSQGKPVFLQNDGRGQLIHKTEALGNDKEWPADLIGIGVADFNGDGFPDIMLWSEKEGLQLRTSQGNGNHWVAVKLTGRRAVEPRGFKVRCNADGLGARIEVKTGDRSIGCEVTTLTAGLGQSSGPVIFGLGHQTEIDSIRVRWPDGVIQAELNQPCSQVVSIAETNRKDTSCPILFTWNGERFVFVTDFLGAGSMGELQPDGTTRPPRPEESVKIEVEQLQPRDGKLTVKLAEPMNEATYLDRLQLIVVDHPADVRVYPDERFSEETPATQELLAFRQEILPIQARDHRGRDVTQTLRKWDRDTVDNFARRSWLGFAEEHWVELDFGDRLAKFSPTDRLILCLAGWTDYPYPESIWAAHQAGVEMLPPILERLGDDGKWHTLVKEAGFPAGLPKMMTLPVTGKLAGPRCVLRLRTNLDIYWDQIFVAPVVEKAFRSTCLEVHTASLSPCGLMQEFSPDGRQPTIYDYYRTQSAPVARLAGLMTRFGDVTELLRDRDDRFVIFGPGDELTVDFDAKSLPVLPPGWKRSYVLRTWGYCKDCAPFTATGETIEPLPFQKMSKYPYGPSEHYPKDALHEDYLRRYNTRQVGPARRGGR
jgi:tetratricopeptide (TPR) repeat protein